MRPLSFALLTAAAVAAAAGASSAASAQDRYSSRGVVYRPAEPTVYTDPSPAGLIPQRASYTGRMLSWPGKVDGPRSAAQPAYANLAPPRVQQAAPQAAFQPALQSAPQPARQARAAAPAPVAAPVHDRYASANSRPDTTGRPYPNVLQPEAPARIAPPRAREVPIRQAALTARPQTAPAPRAPLPQNIYEQPTRQARTAPAAVEPDPSFEAAPPAAQFAGAYPPATKEPWRKFLGDSAPQARGVAIPIGPSAQAPAAAPKAPAKTAKAPAEPAKAAKAAKTADAAAAAASQAAAQAAFQTASAPARTHFYSVHRQFGVQPDRISVPQQFFLDGTPDLSEPPPPPVRRIAPSPGKSTATQRAAQARSQENPDTAG
jgi:hypothetical protein